MGVVPVCFFVSLSYGNLFLLFLTFYLPCGGIGFLQYASLYSHNLNLLHQFGIILSGSYLNMNGAPIFLGLMHYLSFNIYTQVI